jgi:chromosome segregation ATPase
MCSITKQEYSSIMPSKKHRRRNAHEGWDPSETDESFTNGHEHTRNIPNDTGGTSQYIDSQGYKFASNHADGGRSNEANGNNSSQAQQKSTLEACTQAMGVAMESLHQTQGVIKNLQWLFKQNVSELKSVDETSRTLRELQEDCKRKDDDLAKYEMVIDTLNERHNKQRDQVEHERAQIEQEKNNQQQWKEKQEKRFQLELAEEKKKLEERHEERMKQCDEAEKKRKQELEDDIAEKQLAVKKRETEFETEKNLLSSAVKERDRLVESQAGELEKVKEDYEILRRAMDSFKNEKSTLLAELDAMRREFALDPPTFGYL